VTEKGQTKIAPHQSLPSKLLSELCRREKRPQPIFTPVAVVDEGKSSGRQFHYRCTVPDSKKNSEKDLIFIPLHSCPNEEQAQEESALLALLRLTPSLPHERKLPEPYKTTWLQASAATTSVPSKGGSGNASKPIPTQSSSIHDHNKHDTANGTNDTNNTNDTPLTENHGAAPAKLQSKAATATKNLKAQTQYSSEAERKKQEEQQQKQQKLKLYKDEAMRVANQGNPKEKKKNTHTHKSLNVNCRVCNFYSNTFHVTCFVFFALSIRFHSI
jgi:ATP-dependent RNA helicase DHX57